MPPGCNRRLTSLLTLRLGFGLGVFSRCQPRTSGVKHHSLGPFMVRLDPDVDALTQRRPGRRRIGDIARKPPACGKKRGEKNADSDDLARVYRFDLAQDSEMISPTFRFDVARGARRSGCLVSGIGEAAWSILNRGSKDLFFCCSYCGHVRNAVALSKRSGMSTAPLAQAFRLGLRVRRMLSPFRSIR
jgi:hypothetical protein